MATVTPRRLGRSVRRRLRTVLDAAEAWLPRDNRSWLPAGRVPPVPGAFARFGSGSWIVPPADVDAAGRGAIEIGDGVVIMEHSVLRVDAARGGRLRVGDRTILGRGNRITCASTVTLGVAVASSDFVEIDATGGPVAIGDGAYLGFGCVIRSGVVIGRGAVVGEGAVVVDDVPAHTVVSGDPAVVVRRYDDASRQWRDEAAS